MVKISFLNLILDKIVKFLYKNFYIKVYFYLTDF